MFTFINPMWLWALLVVPVLVVIAVLWERDRSKVGQAFADPSVMAIGSDRRARTLRRTALALAILAAAMGPIALARPAVDTTEQKHQGAVILEIDTSKSMQKTDLQPNRLDAAKVAANQFLDSAPEEVLVGLVTFSDRAVVQVAPTLDRIAVRNALDRLQVKEGTALGDAVAAGLGSLSGAGVLNPLPASPAQSAGRIMILTDGAGNVGLSTDDAIARAQAVKVPLYTVMLGNDAGRPDRPPPPQVLAGMATQTGGVFAQTTSTADLTKIFEDLGGALTVVPTVRELTVLAPLIALILLAIAGVLMVFSRRRPIATGPGAVMPGLPPLEG